MSKFIVIKNKYDQKMAVRKDRITDVTENDDENEPTRLWVGNEPYGCLNDFDEIVKELEE